MAMSKQQVTQGEASACAQDTAEEWAVAFAREAVLFEKACQKFVDDIQEARRNFEAKVREREA